METVKAESQQNGIYFQNMDILRFICAMSIVLDHAYDSWKGWIAPPAFMQDGQKNLVGIGVYLDMFFRNLSTGVDMFFLISGFLITFLLITEKEKQGRIDWIKFFIRRALRIWPLYFLLILLTPIAIKFIMPYRPHPDYGMFMLFLGNFSLIKTGWLYPTLHHVWSICIEEHFYLVWMLVVAFLPIRKLPIFFTLIIMSSIIFRGYVWIFQNADWSTLYLHTLSRWDTMALGSLIGYAYYFNRIELKTPVLLRVLVYTTFLCLMCMDSFVNYDNLFTACFKKYIFIGFFIFWMLNSLFNPKSFFYGSKPNILHYFGKISYGIYMFHAGVIACTMELLVRHDLVNLKLYMFLVFGLSLILPIISYELMEKPFLKLKKKFEVVKSRGI